MLGGRVKTLHPRIHAGILARRDGRGRPDGARRARDRAVRPRLRQPLSVRAGRARARRPRGGGGRDDRRRRPVDAARRGEELRPRDAASAAPTTTSRCSPSFGSPARSRSSRAGGSPRRRSRPRPRTRRRSHPGSRGASRSRRSFTPVVREAPRPRATARTRTRARPTTPSAARARTCCRSVEQLHGSELSFNNLNDLDAARLLVREFALPACVIVKHANPCGVAVGASIEEAYEIALAADPLSAYGGVVVLNRAVSATLGERLAEQFVEVLFAPGYDEVALEALIRKQSIRILNDTERRAAEAWRARLQARPRRPARPGPRLGRRGPRGDGGRDRRADRGAVGRPPLRRAASASTSRRTRS